MTFNIPHKCFSKFYLTFNACTFYKLILSSSLCMCRTSATKDVKEDLGVTAPAKDVRPEKPRGKFAFHT